MAQWGVYISIDQLGYPRASVRDAVRLASTLNRDAGLVILGLYNLALSLASIKGREEGLRSERFDAQEALIRNSISEKRLRELRDKLGGKQLVVSPLFHRAQLLTMIKLVAKFGQPSGGNRLVVRRDFDVLSELGLLVNSLWSTPWNVPDVGDAIAPSLAVGLELENPSLIGESMVRASALLGQHLRALQDGNQFSRRVETTFLFSTRMNFEELLDLTFAVLSYYRNLTTRGLVEDQRVAHFNPLRANDIVSGQNLQRLLDSQSIAFWDVPGLPFGSADGPSFLSDHTALRSRPFWKFGEDNYLCVDPAFLQEKLSSGVFWTVMNALDEGDRLRFVRLWGNVFERYLWQVLDSVFTPTRVLRSPRYLDNKDEAFDAIIDYGDALIVCQAKSTFIPVEAKYSANPEKFFAGMESRFGDGDSGALRQIRENLLACFGVEGRRDVEEIKGRSFRDVFPIIVHQEPILGFGLVSRRFARRLDSQLEGALFRLDLRVRPVVYLHIDDFHLIAQSVREGDVTLPEILKAKLALDPGHLWSFDEFWREHFRPERGLSQKGDEALMAAIRRQGEESLERFRNGAYL